MSEMIERVARAIAISDRCDPDKLAKNDPHLMMRSYRQYAQAAIEAMRDPTEQMLKSAKITEADWRPHEFQSYWPNMHARWIKMIDAALGKVTA